MKKSMLLLMLSIVPTFQANPGAGFIARMNAKYGIKRREYVMAGIIGSLLADNAVLTLRKKIDGGGVECFGVNDEWKERIKKYRADSMNYELKEFNNTWRGKIIYKISRFLHGY